MQTLLKDRRAYPSCIPINSITGSFCLHTAHGQTIESQESLSKIITSATQTKQLKLKQNLKENLEGRLVIVNSKPLRQPTPTLNSLSITIAY